MLLLQQLLRNHGDDALGFVGLEPWCCHWWWWVVIGGELVGDEFFFFFFFLLFSFPDLIILKL
jgi:hypothetical protein